MFDKWLDDEITLYLIKLSKHFSGASLRAQVKNPPANAEDMGSISDTGQLSPMPTEARMPRAHAPQEKSPQWAACAPQLESKPGSPYLEKAWAPQQRPSTTVNKLNK